MSAQDILGQLAGLLATGEVEIVDCTGTLGPDTPLLKLPPELAVDTPPVRDPPDQRIRRQGPVLGLELAGAGRAFGHAFRRAAPLDHRQGLQADGYTDTLPVQKLVAPVNVLDFAAECAENPDFLLTDRAYRQVGGRAWRDQRRRMGGHALGLGQARAHDEALFLNADENRAAHAGPDGGGDPST